MIYAALYLYPVISNFRYALTKWDGIVEPEFVGLRNLQNLFTNDDLFLKVFGNNLEFTFLVVIFQTGLSLLFATFLLKNSRGSIALRTLYFFPTILSSVSVAMIWLFLYDPNYGGINVVFNKIGLDTFALNWLGSETSALRAIAFTQVWFHTGQMMVVYIAGLQQIPQELYEAAQVDGASRWQQFKAVTWPMALPTTAVVMAYTTIQSFRAFDLIMVMTNSTAGPNNSTNISKHALARLQAPSFVSESPMGWAGTPDGTEKPCSSKVGACTLLLLSFAWSSIALSARWTDRILDGFVDPTAT